VDQLLRDQWFCPLNHPSAADIANKINHLTIKEVQAVHRLLDELTTGNGED
jgi:hypothetical protein